MSNRKATFAKRQRETELKDRARAKEAQRTARRETPRTSKGPEIAWAEAVTETVDPVDGDVPLPLPAPTPPASSDSAD